MKNIYEEAGGTHQRQGDYERLKLKAPTEREAEIGVWRQYNLLTAGALNEQPAQRNSRKSHQENHLCGAAFPAHRLMCPGKRAHPLMHRIPAEDRLRCD